MKVSFIIPVYNCGQYLEKFVQEIEEIKLQDYEIILVDDGSTDDSGKICDEVAKKNKKVCSIHQKTRESLLQEITVCRKLQGITYVFLMRMTI